MQNFVKRGFQLRTASLETRIAYTGFLTLMVPGVASLVALSVGRMGFSPAAIATYYRGGESEMSFPRTFWQLVEVSHFHLFTIPVVALILTHLLFATPTSSATRVRWTLVTYTGALLDVLGPWAVRYVSAVFAYVLLAGWILLAVGLIGIVAISLASTWGPERWFASLPPPGPNGGGR
jgi:hypothetical protein